MNRLSETEVDRILERASASALTSLTKVIDVEERLRAIHQAIGLETPPPADDGESQL